MHLRRTHIPVLVLVLALTSISSTLPFATLAQEATPGASPVSARAGDFDGLVDIGGRSLHLRCQGEGSPTVILEGGGFGTPSDTWDAVVPRVAPLTRVCRYDRANNRSGRSDPATLPRTAAD